jgi:hypothetical protein
MGAAGLLAGGLAGLILSAPVQAEEPASARLSYALYVGGLNALNFDTRIQLADRRYDIRLQARTAGLTGRLFPFILEGRADGVRAEGRLRPANFATANLWGENGKRWVRMAYPEDAPAQDRVPEVTAEPDPAKDDRKVVPDGARAGTRDPISAVYGLILAEDGLCEGRREVFDGRRRYDVTAKRVGEGEIRESSYAIYAGPAIRCEVRLEKVTGFWEKYDAKRRYPDTVEVWLAEVADDLPPLPVRIEATTLVGALRVHLTGITRGAGARLPDSELFPLKRASAE